MQLPIGPDNVYAFAYTNEALFQGAPRGLIVKFHGLNDSQMIKEPSVFAQECAKRQLLLIQPYDNPWSWMNDLAVKMVDAIVSVLLEKHQAAGIPIVSTGGSMGGLSSLIYTRYSRYAISACSANCPVCDLPYHYTERPDLPRTIVSALAHYEMDFQRAMESISPLHQVAQLPDIPYFIAHCEEDRSVNKQMHSDRLVAAMQEHGKQIAYLSVPGQGHCALTEEARAAYNAFIFSACGVEE